MSRDLFTIALNQFGVSQVLFVKRVVTIYNSSNFMRLGFTRSNEEQNIRCTIHV